MLTMPMNGIFHRKVILHEYLDIVSLLKFDQGTGLLIVDEIDITSEAISTCCQQGYSAKQKGIQSIVLVTCQALWIRYGL
jgi:hypothetical protein